MCNGGSPRLGFGSKQDWAARCVVLLLLAFQWWQSVRFATREIVWLYPTYNDQNTYLDQSYRTFESIRRNGLAEGLADGLGIRPALVPLTAQGALLHVEAALVYCVSGPNRLAAISVNLFHWTVFEIALVFTVGRITGSRSLAFAAFGLAFAAH